MGALSTFRHRFITLRHTRNAIATTTATRLRQNAKHLTSPTLVGETVAFFPFSPLFISHWVTFILRVFSLFLVTLFTFAHCFVQAFQLISDFISDFISFLIGSSRNHEWQGRITFGGVTTWLKWKDGGDTIVCNDVRGWVVTACATCMKLARSWKRNPNL